MMSQNRAKFHFDNNYDEHSGKTGDYILNQAGDLNCEPGYHVMPHTQWVYEISYVFSGSGIFIVNGNQYRVSKDTIILNKINDYHEIVSSIEDPLRFFYIGFNFAQPIESNAILKLKYFYDNLENPVRYHVGEMADIFMNLFSEIIIKDFLTDITISSYLNIINSVVYRTFNEQKYSAHMVNQRSVTDRKLIYDIVNYIDTQVENITALSTLSDEFGYSYSNISKKFNAVMGENINSYYTKRRFAKAKDFLSQGIDVTKTAELMGFKSIHAFSRAFHKYYGITPSEYKKSSMKD